MKKYITIVYCVFMYSIAMAQDKSKDLQQIEAALDAGQTTVSQVLSKQDYMSLHSLTAFRETIKKHAKPERITMVTASEPGTRITVKGTVKDQNGQPVSLALVYVYQTSDKGWYSDTGAHVNLMEGDTRHARLFAYFKTNSNGEFEFETIKPRGYPRSDLPAHIHIAMWKDGKYLHGVPGELLFDDDDRLTPERKRRSIKDGYLIAKNSGTDSKPIYAYDLRISRD